MASVMEDRAKAILRVMAMDAMMRPDTVSDIQAYGISRLCDLFHVTPPTIEKTVELMREYQQKRVLSGGQNLTIQEVYDFAIEAGH